MRFHEEASPYIMFSKTEPDANFFHRSSYYMTCLHMLPSMKEKKVTYRAKIKMRTAHDHPNVSKISLCTKLI